MNSSLAMAFCNYRIRTPDGAKLTPCLVNIRLPATNYTSTLGSVYEKYKGCTPSGRVQAKGAVAFARDAYYKNCPLLEK
jgi:hypothetical protein